MNLAGKLRRYVPADVVGMHFFNPANVMRLLDRNACGAKTAPDVIERR